NSLLMIHSKPYQPSLTPHH
ncbi:hypothetical protein CP99DC5_1162B, partial [Chlamydia psittaci 99DC5]